MPGPRHGRFRGGGRGGHGGGRPRRIRRFLEPAVLLLLHRGPNHGYGIAAELIDLGLESNPVDGSVVYRVLYSLEERGMVASARDAVESAGPPRRVYRLTPEGDAYLRAWVEDLRETERMLRRFAGLYNEAHDAPSTGEDDG